MSISHGTTLIQLARSPRPLAALVLNAVAPTMKIGRRTVGAVTLRQEKVP